MDDSSNPRRLTALARRAAVGSLTTELVHELASAVQGLQGSAYDIDYFLGERTDLDPELMEALQTIDDMTNRIMSIFQVMRRFSRSAREPRREHQVADLVESAAALIRSRTRSKMQLQAPSDDDGTKVYGQEVHLVQALLTLLDNAVDATPEGGEVVIEIHRIDDRVTIAVIDGGPGISDERAAELFTLPRDGSDEGVGLAVAAAIAADHDGELTHRSTGDRGARFELTLPAK